MKRRASCSRHCSAERALLLPCLARRQPPITCAAPAISASSSSARQGSVLIVETTERTVLGRVEGLGDLSHASAVFSPDSVIAYVFGRDGGLTKIDLLNGRHAGASCRPAIRSAAPFPTTAS